ncbi:MAG: hypothetical protein GKC10_04550 [Methanosarcinales archaeon]|nr:hypothetical protein [Methanosarcinales archaeon]
MNCEICGEEGRTFHKVRHRERGCVKICDRCLEREGDRLLPAKGGCDCCR